MERTGLITAIAAGFLMFFTACEGGNCENKWGINCKDTVHNPQDVSIAITKALSMPVGETGTLTVTARNTDDFDLSAPTAAGCVKSGNAAVVCTPTEEDIYIVTVTAVADATKTATATLTVTETSYMISVPMSPLEFGSVLPPYTQPAERMVTITNTGIGSVFLTQPTAWNYDIGALSETIIAAGDTASFTVQPKEELAEGSYDETIVINGNNGASATVRAIFTATPVPTYLITAFPTQMEFGSIKPSYAQPAARTATITNTGTELMKLTQPTAEYYHISALSTTTIESGETATFTIRPKAGLAVGTYYETITTNGNNGAKAVVNARFTVTTDTTYSISASPLLIDFGYVLPPYTPPVPMMVTIANTGTDVVTLTQPTAANYDISALSTRVIASGAIATFMVFPKAELAEGIHSETIAISGSNGAGVAVEAIFTGTTVPSYTISAAPPSLAFGSVLSPYALPAARTVIIANTGTGTVTLTQPTAVNYDIGELSADTITLGEIATFTVQPKAELADGNYDETIVISGSNGADASIEASFTVGESGMILPWVSSVR